MLTSYRRSWKTTRTYYYY